MARFRIVQRPSAVIPGEAIFEVEKRRFFWWDFAGLELSFEMAERRVKELQDSTPVKTKIIKEYD
jgi:hypothetical protein